MANEELHETTAEEQKDVQVEVSGDTVEMTRAQAEAADKSAADKSATAADKDEAADEATEEAAEEATDDATDEDELGIPMDKVEAVLNATIDKSDVSPQMRRMMQRQAENTRRVEESIKGTKSNPRWFVPLFCALMIIGLIWAVVYYLSGNYPIPNIGTGNLAIAFALIMVGFIMTMWWR